MYSQIYSYYSPPPSRRRVTPAPGPPVRPAAPDADVRAPRPPLVAASRAPFSPGRCESRWATFCAWPRQAFRWHRSASASAYCSRAQHWLSAAAACGRQPVLVRAPGIGDAAAVATGSSLPGCWSLSADAAAAARECDVERERWR